MKKKDFYADIKSLHNKIVQEIIALMNAHNVTAVNIADSSADGAEHESGHADAAGVRLSLDVLRLELFVRRHAAFASHRLQSHEVVHI